ncbi:MAG: hypothetical protein EOP62_02510 [Sphingomonadales bacterium]|nr:MAG: hypothetical protein EOP62_02510 [Sphingomonadales bacterium]
MHEEAGAISSSLFVTASIAIHVRFLNIAVKSGQFAIVESFGRREASESLGCPNRGGQGLGYGESRFAQIVG